MFRNPIFSTIFVSTCMLLYQIFSLLELGRIFTAIILLVSPLLMLWMAVTILKDKKSNVQELKEDEEWGYADKERNSLGMF